MTLANVAFRLAEVHALNVIAVDWDLEAPGLHSFFGIDAERMASARGVLDYLEEWVEAAQRGDSAPPDATKWLLPIDQGSIAPVHGSLSLLVAGRLDASYDRRLAGLDWEGFYANSGGALAIETLRKQLVNRSDVVLIDSRTGLTDAGGICTIQLPDGVILMATPNQQSIEGIERVARSIRAANASERAGRSTPRTWLTICRVPSVEETRLTDEWFNEREGWFRRGISDGLWLEEDHPRGMRSFEVPHRARWGFGESILRARAGVDPREPLSTAYDTLAVTLLSFCVGPLAAVGGEPTEDIETLRILATKAEQRKDVDGLLIALTKLGNALDASGDSHSAIEVLRRGVDIAIGADRPLERAALTAVMGSALARVGRYEEAKDAETTALAIARAHKDHSLEANILFRAALVLFFIGDHERARQMLTESMELMRSLKDDAGLGVAIHFSQKLHEHMTVTHERDAWKQKAQDTETEIAILLAGTESIERKTAAEARERGDDAEEAVALERLLKLPHHGYSLQDEAGLRHRLATLKGEAASAHRRTVQRTSRRERS